MATGIRARHSLVPAYRELHAAGQFPGYSIETYVPQIAALVKESGARKLLDYGCGKGRQYSEKRVHEAWGGIVPKLYDPAVPSFSYLPFSQFDGVICTDVLEHVPEEELWGVIGDLIRLSRMWCFISVCCRPSRKRLPDGRNVHVTIRSQEWWHGAIRPWFADSPAELHLAFTP